MLLSTEAASDVRHDRPRLEAYRLLRVFVRCGRTSSDVMSPRYSGSAGDCDPLMVRWRAPRSEGRLLIEKANEA